VCRTPATGASINVRVMPYSPPSHRVAFLALDAEQVLLTGPEDRWMTDDALRAVALKRAIDAGIIDLEATDPAACYPRLTRQDFEARLVIGTLP